MFGDAVELLQGILKNVMLPINSSEHLGMNTLKMHQEHRIHKELVNVFCDVRKCNFPKAELYKPLCDPHPGEGGAPPSLPRGKTCCNSEFM